MENEEDNELHATTNASEAATNVHERSVIKPGGRGQQAEHYTLSSLPHQSLAPRLFSVYQTESSRGQLDKAACSDNKISTTSCSEDGSNARQQLGVYHNLIEEDEL